jgi:hypothetical protein
MRCSAPVGTHEVPEAKRSGSGCKCARVTSPGAPPLSGQGVSGIQVQPWPDFWIPAGTQARRNNTAATVKRL